MEVNFQIYHERRRKCVRTEEKMNGCVRFWREMKGSAEDFCGFAKKRRGVLVVLAAALLLLYGPRLFYYELSIDSELAVLSQRRMLDSWLAIDRFGLVATKKLFGMTRFVPYVSNFLMVLALGLAAFFFVFCMQEWRGKEKNDRLFGYIFPVAYVSAPCFAEQFYFSLQSFEIAWAAFLCLAAVFCIGKWIYRKGTFLWLVPGTIAMVWSISSYQAFVVLFIAIVLVSFLMAYQNEAVEFPQKQGWYLCGLKWIGVFAAEFLLYGLLARISRAYYHIGSSAYVTSMFSWGNAGLEEVLHSIEGDIKRIYLAEWPVFFHKLFLPVLAAGLLLLLVRGWRRRKKGFPMYAAACALLAISPLLLTLVSGSQQPIRGQLVYPFVYAFFLALLTTLGKGAAAKLCCLAAALISLHQGQTMAQLFHTAHTVYSQDKALAEEICAQIQQTGADAGLSEYPVVFVGKRSASLPGEALRGDVIGYSFFEWDYDGYAGATGRIISFCSTLGYFMGTPDAAQVEQSREAASSMPVYPAAGSVAEKDGVIIVKLSEV